MNLLLVYLLIIQQIASAQLLRRLFIPKIPKVPEPRPIIPVDAPPAPRPLRPNPDEDPPSGGGFSIADGVGGFSVPGVGGGFSQDGGGRTVFDEKWSAPSPGPVQTHMTHLEQNVAKEAGKEVATIFVEQLASALLGSGEASLSVATTSMDMIAFMPCIDYASKLSVCAAATGGFYNQTDRIEQAKCLCYEECEVCGGSQFTIAFDLFASSCQRYLSSVGKYSAVASAMDGSGVAGPSFCVSVREAVASISTTRLNEILYSTTTRNSQGSSETDVPPTSEGYPGTAPMLTPSDRKILAGLGVLVVTLAGLLRL